ncbi:hypothetical protein Pcinc_012100 [Petrolisthes cinctipes]|uniref:Myeloid leukemia factor n=1 Tax=Petrolisthes cinctipes TaxID=88211 RepID=A0AAE1KTV8_PETCI|nr:hypothetical protein Pcinc_012100 [Petrolisthes cinctipes]
MSLFGAGFDNDPFFGGHRSLMRHMDQMMSSIMRDPFQDDPFFGGSGMAAITGAPAGATSNALVPHHHPQRPRTASDPFSALGIPSIANMMSSIDQMNQPDNCHMFSSSSVMTMVTGPDGRPQVYQASSSTRGVPGGVNETRRSVSDSRTGTRKMAIGHHIGERSHIIEREQQHGSTEERQEFINLEENEADEFNSEFMQRSQHAIGGRRGSSAIQYRSPRHRQPRDTYSRASPNIPAITASSRYRSRSRPQLSITAGSSEDRGRRRDRGHRGSRSHPHRYHPAQ